MTVAADIEQESKPVALLEIFGELCEAKALLWANYQIELQDAVDELQAWAMERGLVAALGQDAVQAIMAEPFALVRADPDGPVEADRTVEEQDDPDYGASDIMRRWELADPRDRWKQTGEPPPSEAVRNGPIKPSQEAPVKPKRPAKSTIAAFLYVARAESTEQLRDWLARHPTDAPFLLELWTRKCTGR